jgi:hypothetical protein
MPLERAKPSSNDCSVSFLESACELRETGASYLQPSSLTSHPTWVVDEDVPALIRLWLAPRENADSTQEEENFMPARKKGSRRKYGKAASKTVESAMRRRKRGTLRSGRSGKGGKVTSRKQAIAIGLSEARKKGAKVPPRKAA